MNSLERHGTKKLMSSTRAVHVRYNSWCISLPSEQRVMTKFCVVWRAYFLHFSFQIYRCVPYLVFAIVLTAINKVHVNDFRESRDW